MKTSDKINDACMTYMTILVRQMYLAATEHPDMDAREWQYAKGLLDGLAVATGHQTLKEGGTFLKLGAHLGVDMETLGDSLGDFLDGLWHALEFQAGNEQVLFATVQAQCDSNKINEMNKVHQDAAYASVVDLHKALNDKEVPDDVSGPLKLGTV